MKEKRIMIENTQNLVGGNVHDLRKHPSMAITGIMGVLFFWIFRILGDIIDKALKILK